MTSEQICIIISSILDNIEIGTGVWQDIENIREILNQWEIK